jgi:hypothetical protein
MSENSSPIATKRLGDLAKYIVAGIIPLALEIRKLSSDDANIINASNEFYEVKLRL